MHQFDVWLRQQWYPNISNENLWRKINHKCIRNIIQKPSKQRLKTALKKTWQKSFQYPHSKFPGSKIDFQLVQKKMHRSNLDEQGIRTFKNYSIAGLCSVNPYYLLQFCDRLFDQETTTIILMCKSIFNLNISAHV